MVDKECDTSNAEPTREVIQEAQVVKLHKPKLETANHESKMDFVWVC